jgi:hypothetical protein
MLISDNQLIELRDEVIKMTIDNTYMSNEFILICNLMIDRILLTKRWLQHKRHHDEAKFACQVKLIRNAYKYKQSVADKARIDKGYDVSTSKGVYRFIQAIICNMIYSSITKSLKDERAIEYNTLHLDDVGIGGEDEDGLLVIDTLMANTRCDEILSDYLIDKHWRDKRANEFLSKMAKGAK